MTYIILSLSPEKKTCSDIPDSPWTSRNVTLCPTVMTYVLSSWF